MCVVIVVILGAVTGVFDAGKTVHANVVGFEAEIYWDQGCTNRTLSPDWGAIKPGSNKTLTVYIRNEGDSAAHLSMATSNWTPPAR
jgi:archaellum component FlaG (FlaF/FlaG flagellin family)